MLDKHRVSLRISHNYPPFRPGLNLSFTNWTGADFRRASASLSKNERSTRQFDWCGANCELRSKNAVAYAARLVGSRIAAAVAGPLALFLCLATAAQAQDISPTVYAPGDIPPGSGAGTSITLTPIYVRASVGGRCGFAEGQAPEGLVSQQNFDVTGFDASFNFVLDCTGPARVAVVSANGGMFQSAALPAGYTNIAPYDVGLALVGNDGLTATASCEAASLVAGSTTCSTAYGGAGGPQTNFTGPADETTGLLLNGPSTTGAVSSIRVLASPYNAESILVSGSYQDVLTVTLSASP